MNPKKKKKSSLLIFTAITFPRMSDWSSLPAKIWVKLWDANIFCKLKNISPPPADLNNYKRGQRSLPSKTSIGCLQIRPILKTIEHKTQKNML